MPMVMEIYDVENSKIFEILRDLSTLRQNYTHA